MSVTVKSRPITFGTLGPAASNHAFVLSRYLAARGLAQARMEFFSDFEMAFDALLDGALDYVLQVSAHPSHSDCVSRTMGRAYIVDTFIAASKELAILTRTDITTPRTIGLQPATRYYADLSAWSHQVDEPTIAAVAEGLLAKRYDSGITAQEIADQNPDILRVEMRLGAALDAWILFGRRPLEQDFVIWPDAPVTRLLRDTDG